MPDDLAPRMRLALEQRDSATLSRLLSMRVRLVIDTGDESGQTIRSRSRVLALLLSHETLQRCDAVGLGDVNGAPGFSLRDRDGQVLGVLGLGIRHRVVTDIWLITAPDKLARWTST